MKTGRAGGVAPALGAGVCSSPCSWVMTGMVKQSVCPLARQGLTSTKINTQPAAFTQNPQAWAASGQPQASSGKWERKRSCFSNVPHQQKNEENHPLLMTSLCFVPSSFTKPRYENTHSLP